MTEPITEERLRQIEERSLTETPAFLNHTHYAAKELTYQIEGALADAIAKAEPLGWQLMSDLPDRLLCVKQEGDPWEHYYLDEKLLLSLGPLRSETVTDGDNIRITFKREVRKGDTHA